MAAVSLGLSGCAPQSKPNVTPRRPMLNLPPVLAS